MSFWLQFLKGSDMVCWLALCAFALYAGSSSYQQSQPTTRTLMDCHHRPLEIWLTATTDCPLLRSYYFPRALYHGSLRKQRHRRRRQGISAKSTNHSLIHSVALDDEREPYTPSYMYVRTHASANIATYGDTSFTYNIQSALCLHKYLVSVLLRQFPGCS